MCDTPIYKNIYTPIYKNIYAHIPKQQTYCDMSCLGRVPSWDVRNGICNYALKGKWLVFSKHEGKKKKQVECFQNCQSQEQNAIGQLTCLCSSPSAWLSCMPGVLLFFPLKVSYNSSLEKKHALIFSACKVYGVMNLRYGRIIRLKIS